MGCSFVAVFIVDCTLSLYTACHDVYANWFSQKVCVEVSRLQNVVKL